MSSTTLQDPELDTPYSEVSAHSLFDSVTQVTNGNAKLGSHHVRLSEGGRTLPTDDGLRVLETAISFPFRANRWTHVVRLGASASVLFGTGAFLLSQISNTPALVPQLAILGSMCLIVSLGLTINVLRDLIGRLTLDAHGIQVTPATSGFSLRWDELNRWEMNSNAAGHPDIPAVRFWVDGVINPRSVPNCCLSDQNRGELRRILREYAGEKEHH